MTANEPFVKKKQVVCLLDKSVFRTLDDFFKISFRNLYLKRILKSFLRENKLADWNQKVTFIGFLFVSTNY